MFSHERYRVIIHNIIYIFNLKQDMRKRLKQNNNNKKKSGNFQIKIRNALVFDENIPKETVGSYGGYNQRKTLS